MNKNEKKALISFLSIYVGSAILLISVMLYVYYNNEIKSLKESCDMELSVASMKIKTGILNSYMKNQSYIPKQLFNKELKYALYDKNKKLIYSYIDGKKHVDLNKSMYAKDKFNFYITTINEPTIPIKYIVLETCLGYQSKNELKIYIIVTLLISAIFIACIGFLLSKLLLKPVRERVYHLDQFIKDSAHELNTPIAVLMTSVSMLKKGKNPEKMMRYITSSAKQISQIYNDIHFSAFNEMNEDVQEEFDLCSLVLESVEYFNDISITKNIEIEANLNECLVRMDKTKTQKIVNNLISNAIKYSNNNSKIIVSLKDNILHVEDFGIGISPKEQNEIFKRYKRGNNVEGGFGIGLDIVKRVIDEYDLKINLISQEKKGSKFSVDFSNIAIDNKN